MYLYFQNPFLNVTSRNFKRMLLMARDHRDKLLFHASIDKDLLPLQQSFDQCFGEFEDAFHHAQMIGGKYKGYTSIIKSLFEELRSHKVRQWDVAVQALHLEGTPEYVMLLPQKRAPFQKGAYELRLSRLRALSNTLRRFPLLEALKKDVDDFSESIEQARTEQQRVEAEAQQGRQTLAKCRTKLAKEMYRIWGYLICKHHDNPSELSRYYELKYLRAPKEKAGKALHPFQIKGYSARPLFEGALTADSYITIQNSSPHPLTVFTSAMSVSSFEQGHTIEAGEIYSISA